MTEEIPKTLYYGVKTIAGNTPCMDSIISKVLYFTEDYRERFKPDETRVENIVTIVGLPTTHEHTKKTRYTFRMVKCDNLPYIWYGVNIILSV